MSAFIAVFAPNRPEAVASALARGFARLAPTRAGLSSQLCGGFGLYVDPAFGGSDFFEVMRNGLSRVVDTNQIAAPNEIKRWLWCDGFRYANADNHARWQRLIHAESNTNPLDLSAISGHCVLGQFDCELGILRVHRSIGGEVACYFAQHEDRFAIASEAGAVLAALGLPFEINATSAVRFFALHAPSPGQAFLNKVQVLAPGETLCLDRALKLTLTKSKEGVQSNAQNFQFDPQLEKQFHRLKNTHPFDTESIHALASSWRAYVSLAVQETCGDLSVAISLSGGLDSALLGFGMCDANVNNAKAFTWCLAEYESADESQYAQYSAISFGLAWQGVDASAYLPLSPNLNRWPIHPDAPIANPYRLMRRCLSATARAQNYRVMLNGNFGDHLYPNYPDWFIQARASKTAARELIQLARHQGMKSLWNDPGWRQWVKNHLQKLNILPASAKFEVNWLRPEVVRDYAHDSLSRSHMSSLAIEHEASWDAHMDRHFTHQDGVDVRFVFRHPALLAFAKRVPASWWHPGAWQKGLTRLAMRDHLHDSVRLRPKSGSLSPVLRNVLRRQQRDAVADLIFSRSAAAGLFLDQTKLQAAFETKNPSEGDDLLLWLALSYEIWQRQFV